MARTGQSAFVGMGVETTPGTRHAPTVWFPFTSEGLDDKANKLTAADIVPGELGYNKLQRRTGTHTAGGTISGSFPHSGFEILGKHMLGTEVKTGTGPYQRVWTPGLLDGLSATWQKVVYDVNGNAHPFDFTFSKVNTWEIACNLEFVTIAVDIMSGPVLTNQTAATPTFTDGSKHPWAFVDGTVTTVGGDDVNINALSVKGDNKLAPRYFIGQATSSEPLGVDRRDYTGQMTGEFESMVQYNHFVNEDTVEAVVTFTDGTDILTITAQVQFDGDTPKVANRGVVPMVQPFTCVYDGATPPVAITYTNGVA